MKIDFYIMNAVTFSKCYHFACRLIDKAYQYNHKITIYCMTAADANQLDDVIWTWLDTSFIPHSIDPQHPSHIHAGSHAPDAKNLLINLTLEKICGDHWQRVLQIVPEDATMKEQARLLYRYYQKHNYDLTTHQMTK